MEHLVCWMALSMKMGSNEKVSFPCRNIGKGKCLSDRDHGKETIKFAERRMVKAFLCIKISLNERVNISMPV